MFKNINIKVTTRARQCLFIFFFSSCDHNIHIVVVTRLKSVIKKINQPCFKVTHPAETRKTGILFLLSMILIGNCNLGDSTYIIFCVLRPFLLFIIPNSSLVKLIPLWRKKSFQTILGSSHQKCSWKFLKIHRKTPVPDSHLR